MRFATVLMKNFNIFFVLDFGYCNTKACISQILLPYKSLNNKHVIFYNPMVLIFFFTNAIVKSHAQT